MGRRKIWSLIAVLAIVATCGVPFARQATASPQVGYDSIRIQDSGLVFNYLASVEWSPVIATTPDGGAWLFFTAQLEYFDPQGQQQISNRRMFVSRFVPESSTWSPAIAFPSQQVSFGQAAVVDANGTVHVLFSQRETLNADDPAELVYATIGTDGVASDPVPVAPDENAGHQLYPDIAIDGSGGIHAVWQDQRAVDPDARADSAANADIFASDLSAEGTWTAPVQVNVRPDANTNANLPRIETDGDRLVSIWSVYLADSTAQSANRVEWSARPAGEPEGWSEAAILFEQGDTQIGGRFLDMTSDPTGGVVVLYGQRTDVSGALIVRRLPAGEGEWTAPVVVATGDRGSYPKITVGPDGTLFAVYNAGDQLRADVGSFAIAPGDELPGIESLLTDGENGAQGIAGITTDVAGRVWVAYFNEEPQDGSATINGVRVLRGAVIPAFVEEAPPVDATPEVPLAPEATPNP